MAVSTHCDQSPIAVTTRPASRSLSDLISRIREIKSDRLLAQFRWEQRNKTRGSASKKGFDFVASRHRIFVAHVDQVAAEFAVEQQIAQEVRPTAMGTPQTAQQQAHSSRQALRMLQRQRRDAALGRQYQRIDMANLESVFSQPMRWYQVDQAVEVLQTFEVGAQIVEKDTGQRIARDV